MITAKIETEIKCEVNKVFNVICDYGNYPEWRSDLAAVEVSGDNMFIEIDKNGIRTEFIVTENVKDKTLAFDIKNDNLNGRWRGEFIDDNGNAKLIFTESVEVKNVIMKIFAKSFLKKQQNLFMQDLERKLLAD